MNPQLILIVGQLILQYGPEFVQALIGIFHKDAPTLADWNAAFDLAKNRIATVSDMPPVVSNLTPIPPIR